MIHDPQNAATKTTQKEDNSKVPTCKLLYTIWQMEKIYISTAKHIFQIRNRKHKRIKDVQWPVAKASTVATTELGEPINSPVVELSWRHSTTVVQHNHSRPAEPFIIQQLQQTHSSTNKAAAAAAVALPGSAATSEVNLIWML